MMGGGREGEDTLHDGGWEGGRGDHAHSSWECMEEVGGETRKGRGRGKMGGVKGECGGGQHVAQCVGPRIGRE